MYVCMYVCMYILETKKRKYVVFIDFLKIRIYLKRETLLLLDDSKFNLQSNLIGRTI